MSDRGTRDRATADREGGLSPEEAFSILGNETRLAVLRALWEADEPLPFAELRRRTEVETSNFDYHLEKLVGHFVRRSSGGYELRYAGEQVVRAVVAGVLTEDPELPPREIDSRCPYCGSVVELAYEDERLNARCTDCGGVVSDGFPPGTFVHYGFPPAGLAGRTPEAVLEAAHVLYDSKITPMMEGVCPGCASTVSRTFDICEDHARGADGLCETCGTRFEVWTEYTCDRCGYRRKSVMWFRVLTEPAVVAFYHEHGDLEERIPFSKLTWENAAYVNDIEETVVDRDPLRFRVTIPLGDAELRVRLDEDLEILDTEEVDGG